MKRTLLSLIALMLLVALVFSLGACAVPAPEDNDGDITLSTPGADTTDKTEKEDEDDIGSELTGSNDVIDIPAITEPDATPATDGLVFRPNYVYDEEGHREVVSYNVFDYVGTATAVYIPYTYDGVPVVAIGHGAFSNTGVVSVTLPKTLVKIGQYAFRNCLALTTIDIPALVSDIAVDAFLGCTAMDAYTVDDANAKYADVNGAIVIPSEFKIFRAANSTTIPTDGTITAIGESAFATLSITEAVIPDVITAMGANAFAECTQLASITFSANVHDIPNRAFRGCTALKTLSIPEGISSVGHSAFRGCTALATLTIPASMRELGTYSFEGCTALDDLTISPGLTTIGSSSFKGCSRLASVAIPSSVKSIEAGAFWDCVSLSSVRFAGTSSLAFLGVGAFYNCYSLSAISLPASLSAIYGAIGKVENYVFYGCFVENPDETITPITVTLGGEVGHMWSDAWNRCSTTFSADGTAVHADVKIK